MVLLWVIAFGVLWCAGFLIALVWQNLRMMGAVRIQLQGLAEIHRLGLEVLTSRCDRLEKRIIEVEDMVL
jgi:hypothetical protein